MTRGIGCRAVFAVTLALWCAACANATGDGGASPVADAGEDAAADIQADLPDLPADVSPVQADTTPVLDSAAEVADIAVACSPVDCNDNNACTSDACQDGLCAHLPVNATCSDGDACTVGDTCKTSVCLPGQLTTCDDNSVCTTDSCAAGSGCAHAAKAGDCSDGDICTVNDTCKDGACQSGANICDDGNPCTKDSCKEGGGCLSKPAPAPCQDGNPCTTDDQCDGGVCMPGAPTDCNDGKVCTNDSCNVALGGCQHANNTLPCDDGDTCTLGDKCGDGSCAFGKKIPCNDGNACTDDVCDNLGLCAPKNSDGGPCQDGNGCTAGDKCQGGVCLAGAVTDCNDGNVCTVDYCDFAKGCVNLQVPLVCDDGSACTTNDVCTGGVCGGKAKVCDDGNPCTEDGCSAQTGCKSVANTAKCNDDNACTTNDGCTGGVCGGSAKVCDDGNACTDDSCDKTSGCVALANTATCSDGESCTVDDKCANKGCQAGAAKNCDDSNPCTEDACDKTKDCMNVANTASCSDGNPCTVGDKCANKVCQGASTKDCSDGNACTNDTCDSSGGCVSLPNSQTCTDGSPCTVGDKCAAGACLPGAVTDCNDGNPCSTDNCVITVGCTHGSVVGSEIPVCDGTAWQTRCYKGFGGAGSAKVTWKQAEAACVQWGGHLASIASKAENDKVYEVSSPFSGVYGGWIGATDEITEGVWKWTDGTPFVYKNWQSGEPNNQNNIEHFARNGGAGWNDLANADALNSYVCERGLPPACDDGSLCTVNDGCPIGGKCAGVNKVCDDANACTTDSCDPATGCVTTAKSSSLPACDGSEWNGHCYKKFSTSINWQASEAECVKWGGHLASIASPEENAKVNQIGGGGWIGANDVATEGQFAWSDGSAFGYKGWRAGEPNDAAGEDCAEMEGTGFWNDSSCAGNKPFICERDPPTDCTDSNPCTEGDKCVSGKCSAGPTKFCNDGNACTDDSCTANTGHCAWVANTATCTDKNVCTVSDKCAAGACVAGTLKACSDNNACTTDVCHPVKDCVFPVDAGGDMTTCDGTVANGRCYKAVATKVTWAQAEADCVQWGGHLASIGSSQEHNTLQQLNKEGWIGASDAEQEGTWIWSDGTPYTFNQWDPGSLVMAAQIDDWDCAWFLMSWRIDQCKDLKSYICERGPPPTCNDASACTTQDKCVGGSCSGTAVNCNDGNACTADSCAPVGGCKAVALSDGATCASGGVCASGVCKTAECGNGKVESGEACDDGNTGNDDGCGSACVVEAGWSCSGAPSTCSTICGDGVKAGKEECDDKNTNSGDGCSTACKKEADCSNGSKDGAETDVDCGGSICGGCLGGLKCALGSDCLSKVCTLAGTCATSVPCGDTSGLQASSPFPMAGMCLTQSGLSKAIGPHKPTVAKNYQVTGTSNAGLYGAPAIGADGTIYAAGQDGKVYAVKQDGTVLWTFTAGNSPHYVVPALGANGTLYVGTVTNGLHAIDSATGQAKWKFTTGGSLGGSPTIGPNGTVYIGCEDNKLYAVKPDGGQAWTYTTGGVVRGSPAIAADGTIYTGSTDKKVHAIKPDGSPKWQFTTGSQITSSVVIDGDGTVFAAPGDGLVYRIAPAGSAKGSALPASSAGVLALGPDGTLFDATMDGMLYAFAAGGMRLWGVKLTGGVQPIGPPIVGADGLVYLATGYGSIHGFMPKTGAEKWLVKPAGQMYGNLAMAADGTLWFGNPNGILYALRDAAACGNLTKDGSETDSDCGGGACKTCAVGKTCSAGSDCQSGVCSGTCQAPKCGDGVIQDYEQCDDSGTSNGDGCAATCVVEATYTCSGSPSVCALATKCTNNPCKNGGTCTGDANTYSCTCKQGYGGTNCDKNIMGMWGSGPLLTVSRTQHNLVLLNDGRVLAVGGLSDGNPLAGADILNPTSNSIAAAGKPMAVSRNRMQSAVMTGGLVVVAFGSTAGNAVVNNIHVFDPVTNNFDAGTTSNPGRVFHTVTALNDGRALIVGGSNVAGTAVQGDAVLFNPTTKAMTTVSIGSVRRSHVALKLANGKVLVAAGMNASVGLTSGFVFDPTNDSVKPIKATLTARSTDNAITQLGNGKVLISGGNGDNVDVYDPVADSVQVVSTGQTARWNFSTTLLKDGRVLFAGGQEIGQNTPLSTTILFDPSSNTFKPGPTLPTGRRGHLGILLDDGRVLLVGGLTGTGNGTATNTAMLFVPATNNLAPGGSMVPARTQIHGIKLNDGRVWMAGGYTGTSGGYLSVTDFFQ